MATDIERIPTATLRRGMLLAAVLTGIVTGRAGAQLAIGARGGANFAEVLGGDRPTHARTGFNVGAYAVVPVTSDFGIQPELNYSQKGGAQLPIGIGGAPVFDYVGLHVDYVEMALLGRFSSVGARAVPFLAVGPVVSAVSRCAARPSGGEAFGEVSCDDPGIENPTDPRKLDIGALVAGGVEISGHRTSAHLDVRFHLGLLPFDRSGPIGVADRRSRVISINLGIGRRLPSVRVR